MGLPHQRGNTLYGSEDPSWLHSPHSNRCGLASKNMMNLAHQLCTESASKHVVNYHSNKLSRDLAFICGPSLTYPQPQEKYFKIVMSFKRHELFMFKSKSNSMPM